jgi:hypothetical protein
MKIRIHVEFSFAIDINILETTMLSIAIIGRINNLKCIPQVLRLSDCLGKRVLIHLPGHGIEIFMRQATLGKAIGFVKSLSTLKGGENK